MKNYFEGSALKVVEKGFQGNIKELAINFLLYGALAEIFARENGFNKGLGGSMHAFFRVGALSSRTRPPNTIF